MLRCQYKIVFRAFNDFRFLCLRCIMKELFRSAPARLRHFRHDLFHAVTGVKQGTAPEFWKHHPLSSKAGFARVGLLSLKGFSTKGASPRWGMKGSRRVGDRART